MKWNIVADSSCDLFDLEQPIEGVSYSSIPFVIQVDDKEYVDDASLDTTELVRAMMECKEASRTACPAPGDWAEAFEQEGCTIALTISSNLSGSYNSACTAKNMVLESDPDKQIAVVDTFSTGPEMIMTVRKICEDIQKGCSFETVVANAQHFVANTHIVFVLSSFDNLIKNGRISKLKGFLANKLGLMGIGIGTDIGKIDIKGIERGRKRTIDKILQDMEERGMPEKEVVITHCQNQVFALELKQAIQKRWKKVEITILPTRGLCSYYAEKGGLIVSY